MIKVQNKRRRKVDDIAIESEIEINFGFLQLLWTEARGRLSVWIWQWMRTFLRFTNIFFMYKSTHAVCSLVIISEKRRTQKASEFDVFNLYLASVSCSFTWWREIKGADEWWIEHENRDRKWVEGGRRRAIKKDSKKLMKIETCQLKQSEARFLLHKKLRQKNCSFIHSFIFIQTFLQLARVFM